MLYRDLAYAIMFWANAGGTALLHRIYGLGHDFYD